MRGPCPSGEARSSWSEVEGLPLESQTGRVVRVVQVARLGAAHGLLGDVRHGAAHGELHEAARGLEGEPQPHRAAAVLAPAHQ